MGRHRINMAIKFRLENSRVREKENYLMLLKGSGILDPLCVTRKRNVAVGIGSMLSEGLHTWSINFYKAKKESDFIVLIFFPRRMKQNQKTAYLMYQAMKVHENSWHMPRQKGFGCLWEKKSKSCSVRLKIFQMSLDLHIAIRLLWGRAECLVDK